MFWTQETERRLKNAIGVYVTKRLKKFMKLKVEPFVYEYTNDVSRLEAEERRDLDAELRQAISELDEKVLALEGRIEKVEIALENISDNEELVEAVVLRLQSVVDGLIAPLDEHIDSLESRIERMHGRI